MSDYKDTLNLPKTGFPMKANLVQREPETLKFWQEIELYKKRCEFGKNSNKYILHDGPPYANGRLHNGHALNKILKDIVVKSKILSGYDSPYVPGWDCHGLPIEINVEKKAGKIGDKISRDEFLAECRKYAAKQVDLQRDGFVRLGVIGDWQNPYLSMNYKFEANVIRSLAQIIANGHLVHGRKPVHWCTVCGSALAEAEVEYKDKESPAIDVRFRVVDVVDLQKRAGIDIKLDGDISVPIWTTTPWTLPANQAVALHPELTYVLVHANREYLIVAEDLLASVMARYGIEKHEIIAHITGSNLEGLMLQHPFLARQVPVILGDHVTVDAGTGAVHTAPGHGQEDYIVASKYDLPIENPVDNKGCFLPNTEFFAGVHVFKANPLVIEVLQEKNSLINLENIQHSYPHCWRHKTPLIFRATPQWFISMDKNGLRKKALQEIEKVHWIPAWGKARIQGMVADRPDWCISRQRTWGTPMSLFVNKESGELHPRTAELLEEIANKIQEYGIEYWFNLDPKELLGEEADSYEKINDTLDVWFDSGVTHACVLRERSELAWPADLYLEGSDQHRGWFQSSLLTAVAMYGEAPYRNVLTHGFVVDAKGHKMSKSVGNVIEPDKIIKQFGADVLRLWVSSADYSAEIPLSDESLKRAADAYRRIRNTARFLLANTNDFDYAENAVADEQMLALDKWAVDAARILQEEIKDSYDKFQFHQIYHKVHNFCALELGGFYLDIIKDRQYTMQENSVGRRSAQTAMYHILQALVRLIAPILSFTAEEIWKFMRGANDESVLLTTWYEDLAPLSDAELMNQEYWQQLMQIRDDVNKELEKQRNDGKFGSALAADVALYAENDLLKQLNLLGDELRFVFITGSAQVWPLSDAPKDAIITGIPGLKLSIAASKDQKCIRCWQYRADVGENKEHPEICGRCITNVTGPGEERQFA